MTNEQMASPQVTDKKIAKLTRVIDCLEILNARPRPMCRDCADECGVCPHDSLDCDMKGLIASARALLSAPPAAVKINLPSISPLRLFVGAAVPCSTEIDPRGYQWCEPYLDAALSEVNAISAPLEAETIGEITLAGWRIDWPAKHPNSVGAVRWVGSEDPAYKDRMVKIGGISIELFEKEKQ